ncbi:LytR family transcriptional regulator [Nocardioides marmoriginsengisoli]|uniref:LytR family transcriptional regulator n=1 Tax=Nocardioides marmoriginsengisoli TaxID=661483 RepID=A0A3N0CBR3_9ACTN|nr:LytR family transcriptional regulator [Nocardioides marmoriginsengisoli]
MVTLVPALILGVIGGVLAKVASGPIKDLVFNPSALLWVVVVLAAIWVLWIALIWRVYSFNRSHTATRGMRVAGALGVMLMCLAVTAPMAKGAQYALVQRDLINSVFGGNSSATTPKDATEENPWGNRKRVNVLLLGGDGSVHRPGVRTDSVILASIDTRTGKTVLFSLPRNLQDVPFKPGSKLAALYPNGFTNGTADNAEYFLNAVYRNVPAVHPGVLGKTANEGADAVKLAVAGALGIPVDYYVLVNLAGFRQLVDAIGGITVNINERVPIGGNTDAGIPPDSYLEPGPNQRLNGFNALWFTRGRYGSTDYKRMERQRCAINAIAKEASPTKMLKRYTRLAKASKEIVRTDIPQKLLTAFVDLAGKVKSKPIKAVGFERSAEFDPNNPDFDFMRTAVANALKPAVRKPSAGGSTGTPGNGSTPSSNETPSKASNAEDDCAYQPVS